MKQIREISVTAVFNEQGELTAIVAGERTPTMYTCKQFKKSDYELFLNSFIKDNNQKDE